MTNATRRARQTSPVALLLLLAAPLGSAACGGGGARAGDGGADTIPVLMNDGGPGGDATPDGRAHPDAPVDAGACWEPGECTAPAVCLAHGDESCPPCPAPTADCASDSQCADDGPTWICEAIGCGCFHECVPGCTNDSACPAWTICGADHRCGPKPCGGDGGLCPADFACEAGHCARKHCADDADCSSACVKGLCYDRPGVCTAPTPI